MPFWCFKEKLFDCLTKYFFYWKCYFSWEQREERQRKNFSQWKILRNECYFVYRSTMSLSLHGQGLPWEPVQETYHKEVNGHLACTDISSISNPCSSITKPNYYVICPIRNFRLAPSLTPSIFPPFPSQQGAGMAAQALVGLVVTSDTQLTLACHGAGAVGAGCISVSFYLRLEI